MSDVSAPSGLKLTEEQVARIKRAAFLHPTLEYAIDAAELKSLCTDWCTLRAACDEKDAEIARLAADHDGGQQ